MIRRLQIRRENTLLLVAMRISYGGTILALLAAIKDSVHGAFSGVMAWDRPLSNLSFARGISWVVTD